VPFILIIRLTRLSPTSARRRFKVGMNNMLGKLFTVVSVLLYCLAFCALLYGILTIYGVIHWP